MPGMRYFSAHCEMEVSCLLQHLAVGTTSSCCSSILPPEIDAARKGIHQQQTQKNTAGRLLCTESPARGYTSGPRYGRLHKPSWHASVRASREWRAPTKIMLTHRMLCCNNCSAGNGHVAPSRGFFVLRRFLLSEGTHAGKTYSAAAPLLDCAVYSALLSRLPCQAKSPEVVVSVRQAQMYLMACKPKRPALMGSNTLRDWLMQARVTLSASHRVRRRRLELQELRCRSVRSDAKLARSCRKWLAP